MCTYTPLHSLDYFFINIFIFHIYFIYIFVYFCIFLYIFIYCYIFFHLFHLFIIFYILFLHVFNSELQIITRAVADRVVYMELVVRPNTHAQGSLTPTEVLGISTTSSVSRVKRIVDF
jgi:hypothetical protein